jgi:ABC-type polysaccharide/polyol phosphate export permease
MSLQFIRDKPVQACKLITIILTGLFVTGGVFGLIPNQGLNSLFSVVYVSIGLVLVITAETLLSGFRSVGTDSSLADQFNNRPTYIVVRVIEILGAILSVGGLIFVIAMLPEGPMAGPGAIGLLFIVAGLGALLLAGSLIRTVTEFYYYRRTTTS